MTRVRVRGIYATALAKVLIDSGFELCDVSRKLSERLGGFEGSSLPPHVTVKQTDRNPHDILVNGFYEEGKRVYEKLIQLLELSPRYVGTPPLHSAYRVRIGTDCLVEIKGVKVRVISPHCYEGKETVVEITRTKVFPMDEAVAEEGFRVQGFYVELIVGRESGVSFSRHIKNIERKLLLSNLSRDLVSRGFKVHWRSSARNAPLEELRRELEELLGKVTEIERRLRSLPIGAQVYEGEFIGLIKTSLEDKLKMDLKRGEVLSTMPYHHTLKAGGDKFSTAVELGDRISPKSIKEVKPKVKEFLLESSSNCKEFVIYHEKLDGDVVKIGPIRRKEVTDKYLVLRRKVMNEGTYDGLRVKKEIGDTIITLLEPFSNRLVHGYFSNDGDLKGVYVNINTGVEIGECHARYIDLEVDVTYDYEVRIIDKDTLERMKHFLTPSLVKYVEDAVKEATNDLESGRLQGILRSLATPS